MGVTSEHGKGKCEARFLKLLKKTGGKVEKPGRELKVTTDSTNHQYDAFA